METEKVKMESFESFLEMPLGFYGKSNHLQNDFDWYFKQFFQKTDQNIIERGIAAKKLESQLNKSPYTFNILFYPADIDYNPTQLAKEIFDIKNNVKHYLQTKNIPTEGRITFVKTSSSGDSLTPWMTLHTLGHALISSSVLKEIMGIIAKITISKKDQSPTIYWKLAQDLFLFKSVKNVAKHHLETEVEVAYELVAEYLWHNGKIRINPQAQNLFKINIQEEINKIENIIKRELDKAVGQILVDANE